MNNLERLKFRWLSLLSVFLLSTAAASANPLASSKPQIETQTILAAPTGVQARASLVGAITVEWNAMAGAIQYVVAYSLSEDKNYQPLATVNVTAANANTRRFNYRHTSLGYNETYFYKVTAVTSSGNTDYSLPVKATTHPESKVFKIMPLGDSNTNGNKANDTRPDAQKISYRKQLYDLLTNAKAKLDYVGSQHSGSAFLADDAHAGFSGARTRDILSLLKTSTYQNQSNETVSTGVSGPYLDAFSPDVILLHIGTNGGQYGVSDDPETIAEVAEILNEVDRYEARAQKEVTVIFATIINRVPLNADDQSPAYTSRFNTKIAELATKRMQEQSDRLVLVDMEKSAGIRYNWVEDGGDMADHLHPAPSGYQKMANTWFGALKPLLQPTTADRTAPETTIATKPAAIVKNSSALFEFGSNEANVYFELSLNGAAFASTTNPVTLTGLADGTHTVSVRAVDAAGNRDATPATYSWVVDSQPPAPPAFISIAEDRGPVNNDQITSDNTIRINGRAEANAVVRVSENGGGLLGTATANSTGDWIFSYEATALPQGTYGFTATSTDAAGNVSTASSGFTLTIDLTAPTVAITTAIRGPVNKAFSVSIKFSEAVYGLDAADFSVTNGTLGNLNTADRLNYTATVTPAAGGQGVVAVTLPVGAVTDLAGNGNTLSSKLETTYDFKRPSLAISTAAPAVLNLPFTVTVTFDEAVTGFGADDISVANGAVNSFTAVSVTVYTVLITPAADGEVSVQVTAEKAFDAATNGNVASAALKRVFDVQQPSVTLNTDAAAVINKPFNLAITFSEPVTGLVAGDITVKNGTASQLQGTSGADYTMLITPTADGEVTVMIGTGAVQDAASNSNTGSAVLSRVYDATRPTVAVASTAPALTNAPFTATFDFSEDVEGFVLTDIALSNATATNYSQVSKKRYTALVTPAKDGEVSVQVATDKAFDAATNGNTGSAVLSRFYDATRPTVAVTSTAPALTNAPFTATFDFSEDVEGFVLTDIALSNATAANFSQVSKKRYIALVTPAKDGEVSVQVTADKAFDAATNGNVASTALVRIYDVQKPSAVLSTDAPERINRPFTLTITFSEPITGLAAGDIAVTNGTASQLQATGGSVYSVLITPGGADGEVTVAIKADATQDAASNGNTGSAVLSRVYDATPPTVAVSTTAPALTNAPFTATFSFSEDVEGFALADIGLANATASSFNEVSRRSYTALITPTMDGEVRLAVVANSAQDAATNGNTASNVLKLQFDATAPAGYMVKFEADRVDVINQESVSVNVTGAEVGATYFYTITSSNGGEAVSGTAPARASGFVIPTLNLQGLPDGTLTVTFYQVDAAGNRGNSVTAEVLKVTRNIAAISNPAPIQVPFKTAFERVPLPSQLEVSYSNGEKDNLQVNWQRGDFDSEVPGIYNLIGTVVLAPNSTNTDGLTARVAVEVERNKTPTALSFSATSFKPDAEPQEVIGTFSTIDPDDTQHVYELIGSGNENGLFEIIGNQLFLKSNSGLSGLTAFTITVRSIDPYQNTIEKTFTLNKSVYQPETKIKLVNAFSPDNDGYNDTWTVPELRYYNEIDIQVFDRAGVLLFHTVNPEEGWDGRGRNGKVLPGSYFYIIQVKDVNLVQKGVLTILK